MIGELVGHSDSNEVTTGRPSGVDEYRLGRQLPQDRGVRFAPFARGRLGVRRIELSDDLHRGRG